VVIKFVPSVTRVSAEKNEKISTRNLFIFAFIFFTVQSFTFVFPHPDNHWIVSGGLELVIVACATSLSYLAYRFEKLSSSLISATLGLLSTLCALGAWQSSTTSSWGHYIQSWFVLSIVKSLCLSLVILTTRFVCEVSSCYISTIFAISCTGCIIFPNSISFFSTSITPLEITYSALFGIACILFTFVEISSPVEPRSKSDFFSGSNFSKIPLIGQVSARNYGSSGA